MIMHDWGEDRCRAILHKCFAALPSGGGVIIGELLVNDARTGPPPGALMSLNMLVETEGRNYTQPSTPGGSATPGFWISGGRSSLRGADGLVIGYKP